MNRSTGRREDQGKRMRKREKPVLRVSYLEEPKLILGDQQEESDPKLGLFNFGPYSLRDEARHPSRIRLGIIGSGQTVADCKAWLSRIQGQIDPVARVRKQVRPFPGFASDRGPFQSAFVVDPPCVRTLSDNEITTVTDIVDRRRAFDEGLRLLLTQIQIVAQDHHPAVIIVALPQRLYDVCRAVGGPRDRTGQVQLTPTALTLLHLSGPASWPESPGS